ncbi:hypothetical protein CDD82_2452 [Ophiocordyceps australis]|uniref:CBM1 domain-containing protein n=1 Tax=Ophiocordyceps australis TaxID=1399860 RepID=A0A2C5X7C7_9HYPO|nr:hypothetical protein CDD82_2452 [Ophiocordyceps australis]
MKSASLVAAATGLITTVVATDPLSPGQCTLQGRECEWFGASPFCGSTNSRLGDLDPEGREYYTSTETLTWSDLCEEPTRGKDPETDCCNAYGSRCWGGYKRLWCKPKPESEPVSK